MQHMTVLCISVVGSHDHLPGVILQKVMSIGTIPKMADVHTWIVHIDRTGFHNGAPVQVCAEWVGHNFPWNMG